jgi:hypothetical protein
VRAGCEVVGAAGVLGVEAGFDLGARERQRTVGLGAKVERGGVSGRQACQQHTGRVKGMAKVFKRMEVLVQRGQ